MEEKSISIKDKEAIRKYFEADISELDTEKFKAKKKALRSKYHPDNFEKFEDETVKEMATERFQLIEELSGKIEAYLKGNAAIAQADRPNFKHPDAVFAARKLKIEIITQDKDLKYQLFGSRYRWLLFGESFKIPKTGASIIIDEDHKGVSIGYRETIRLYLTFEEQDSIEDIVDWMYPKLVDRANYLIISKEKIDIDPLKIGNAIRQVSFLRIGA